MKKILLVLMLGMFLISFTSGAVKTLGTFEKDENVRVAQVCSDATSINISSISYPNSTIAVSDIEMISFGNGEFYYHFNLTSVLGRYDIRGIGNGCEKTFATYLIIGNEMDTGEAILYSLFILILFGVSVIIFCAIIKLPSDNIKGPEGEIMAIVKLKYLRIILIAVEYLMFIIIFNLINGILINFGNLLMFSNIAGFLFETMMRLSWPFIVFILAWIIYNAVKDTNFKKAIKFMHNPLGNALR